MPEVPVVVETENSLIKVYEDAWERVIAQQQALVDDPLKAARRARLAEMRASIEATMEEVEASSRAWIEQRLPQLYATGGTVGAGATGASEFLWTAISQEAVEELAFNLMDEVLAATKHVNATTKSLVRAIARSEGLQKLIEGKTAVQAGREMSKLIAKQGIAAITYKNGAKHGLDSYGEMLARTTTAKAYNIGTLNGAAQNGCQFWEVIDGPDCGWSTHDSGELALGKIVSRDEALEFPISHPNCRRTFGPRPDLTGPASAGEGKGQVTPEQVAAQRAQDAQLAEKQARGSARRQQQQAVRDSRKPAARTQKRAAKIEKRKPAPQTSPPLKTASVRTTTPERGRESGAVNGYKDPFRHTSLQKSLRSKEPLSVNDQYSVDGLDAYLEKGSVAEEGSLYRGVVFPEAPKVGSVLTDHGYTSTSTSSKIAEDFARIRSGEAVEGYTTAGVETFEGTPYLMDIRVKAGQAANAGDDFAEEIILPRGTSFRVVAVKDGRIQMEVVT